MTSFKTICIWRVPSHPHIVWTGWVPSHAREYERVFTCDLSSFPILRVRFMNIVARRRLSNVINCCISLSLLSGMKASKQHTVRLGRDALPASMSALHYCYLQTSNLESSSLSGRLFSFLVTREILSSDLSHKAATALHFYLFFTGIFSTPLNTACGTWCHTLSHTLQSSKVTRPVSKRS